MTQVGTVYGEALYELCHSEALAETVLEQLTVLDKSFEAEPDFLRLLAAPNLTKEERCRILDDSFRGKVHPYVLNFLKILTEKGYARHFHSCLTAYQQQYDEHHGILPVTAVTSQALTEEQTRRLQEKLAAITGKTIRLQNRIDPACLGGIRLDYNGICLDDTVSHRLEAIRNLLKNTVL